MYHSVPLFSWAALSAMPARANAFAAMYLVDGVQRLMLTAGLAGAELATIANEAAISAARRGSQQLLEGDFLVRMSPQHSPETRVPFGFVDGLWCTADAWFMACEIT